MDDAWLSDGPVEELLRGVVEKAVRQYRIAPEEAERIVRESLAGDGRLQQAAAGEPSAAKLARTRAFKEAAAEAKRRVYYYLRTYKTDEAELVRLTESLAALPPGGPAAARDALAAEIVRQHASTRERVPRAAEFYRELFARVGEVRTVVDVGCGLHPLMFPLDGPGGEDIQQYVALEKDPRALECLEAYARAMGDGRIVAVAWDIADGWPAVVDRAGVEQFDLALLMKLVPVVARQRRDLLGVLAQTPARQWVVTGSRVSMTRRASIERRERAVLREFVQSAGRELEGEFAVGEEFTWVVS